MKSLPLPACNRPALAAAAVIALAANAQATPSNTIVISQVYGGGGNAGAPYTNDFIELHNISNSNVNLAGWRIQYNSAAGTTWSNGLNLSGTISAGGYFLIQMAAGSTPSGALPAPDLTGTVSMAGTAGKVALTNTTTALTGANPSADPAVVDFVGYGTTANGFEGTGPTPAPGNTTSVTRKDSGSLDTDDNATDFVSGAPSPRNSSSTPYIPGGDSTPPTISTRTPADDATGVAVTTNLVAAFSENIVKGTGDITLKLTSDNSTVATVPVTAAAVVVSGATATITLPASLAPSTGYYVNIASGAFKDAANNNFAGIADNSTWNFTTGVVDNTAPALVGVSPADDSGSVLPTTNLAITHDENILKGGGSVVIRKLSDNSTVESIAVSSGQVTVSGATATINPSVVLDFSTAYYVEAPPGAFTDAATNGTAAITGNAAWNFTTRSAPQVLISQYYEGAGSDRYIELKNMTGSPLALDGYRVVAWSDTAPSDNEGWKSGTGTSDRVTDLTGKTIPANGTFLIAETAAANPIYAANNSDLQDDGGCTAINGDDSVVLYNGPGFTQAEVVDAVSIAANDGQDKSFHRLNNGVGFDFSAGTSILNYSGVWGTKTPAEVASALPADAWYLSASQPIGTLTLGIDPASFSEAAGLAAATATVTRSGSTAEPLFVTIASSNPDAADAQAFVEIPAGSASAGFPIDVFDNAWLTGDQQVAFTISAFGYLPASDSVTVTDQPGDAVFPVVINEVDADLPGTETAEFIELYNNSASPVSLDGVTLVFYNGGSPSGEASYLTLDLSGNTIPANGFFVVGNAGVPGAAITFNTDTLQNGPDAVALYVGNAALYPNGTLASSAPGYLADAVVHETNDADATVLLNALTPGKPQVDEGANPASETVAIARVPNGGARFDTTLYVAQAPTPGATNVLAPPNTLASWMGGFSVAGQTGFNDDYDKDGLVNALENILGSSPAVAGQGITQVSRGAGTLVFRHTRNATPASDLTPSYEWSADLVNWNASGASAGGTTVTFGVPVVVTPGTPDLVEVTATVSGTAARVFCRLKVTQP